MRHPRALMREIIEPYVEDALKDITEFPIRRSPLEGVNPSLQNTIYNKTGLDDSTKIRLAQFMYIWGDGTSNIYEKKGVKYIGGIATDVYTQLGLPIIDGNVIDVSEVDHTVPPVLDDSKKDEKKITKNPVSPLLKVKVKITLIEKIMDVLLLI